MITARTNQNKKLFFVEIQESDLTARTCHEENGKYYFQDKDDRQYQNCEIKKDEFQIELLSYAGPLFEPNYLFLKETMAF